MMTRDFNIYFKVISKDQTNVFYGEISFGECSNERIFTDPEYKAQVEASMRQNLADSFSLDISHIILVSEEEYIAETKEDDVLVDMPFDEEGAHISQEDENNLEYLKEVANN